MATTPAAHVKAAEADPLPCIEMDVPSDQGPSNRSVSRCQFSTFAGYFNWVYGAQAKAWCLLIHVEATLSLIFTGIRSRPHGLCQAGNGNDIHFVF